VTVCIGFATYLLSSCLRSIGVVLCNTVGLNVNDIHRNQWSWPIECCTTCEPT